MIFSRFDYLLLALILLVNLLGIVTIYSTQSRVEDVAVASKYWTKQLLWFLVGLVALFIVVLPDYKFFNAMAPALFVAELLLLLLVFAVGVEMKGAKRWLSLGGFYLQPSEFAKLVFAIALSSYFARFKDYDVGIKRLLVPAMMFVTMVVLIARQPDLGTALVLVPIFVAIVFTAGLRVRIIIVCAIVLLLLVPLSWHTLKDYQRARITAFLNPQATVSGSGYQQYQSIIAVGSGGVWGKGFLQGTQSKLKFLPQQHTDLIFSAFAEEWGFFGVLVLLVLYAFIVLRLLENASLAKDRFGHFFCTGMAAFFFSHIFVNIAMVVGILPITGLPLPFMSYGGSFLLLNMVCIGIVINIRMRRFVFE